MEKQEGAGCDATLSLASRQRALTASLSRLLVQDLKIVLQLCGVSKQGRKAELIDRIVAQCGDMTSALSAQVAARVHGLLVGPRDAPSGTGPSTTVTASAVPQTRVQCVCNSMHQSANGMVRCVECAVVQHQACVMSRPYDSIASPHVCEVCRLNEVDPTCNPVGEHRRLCALFHHQPTALTSTRRVQAYLRLAPDELALLASGDRQYQLRLYALDISPPTPAHRWPVALALTVNAVEVELRVPAATWCHYSNRYKVRPADEVLVLSEQPGIKWQPVNLLVFDAVVQSSCVVVVQLVRAIKSDALLEQLLAANAQPLEAARAKLLERCFPEHEDEDLMQTAVNLSLRCPLTLTRLSTPARSSECTHPECFDLEAHLQMQFASKCPKWQCPLCQKSARPRKLQIDTFVKSLLDETADLDYKEVELQPAGDWKPPRGTDETPRAKRQRSGAGPSTAPPPRVVIVHDLGDELEAPPARAPSAAAQPAPPSLVPAAGVAGSAAAALPSSAAQPAADVLRRTPPATAEVERVFAEAIAAARRDPAHLSSIGEQHPEYAHIRQLFLSLDPDPTAPGALNVAHERAVTLLGNSARALPTLPGVGHERLRTAVLLQPGWQRCQPAGRGSVSVAGSTPPPAFGSQIPRPGDADNPICLD